jgi:hypothetical protein
MGLKYRWMQKKDLEKLGNKSEDFVSLLKSNRTVANVAEAEGEILGWVVYKILNDKIKILKIGFRNDNTVDFIMKQLFNKKDKKPIEILVSEYDLKMQITLRKTGFLAIEIKKTSCGDFYKFII